MSAEPSTPPQRPAWFLQLHDRRFYVPLALGTLIISVVWHLPQELQFISERAREIVLMLVLALGFTYLLRPAVNFLNRLGMFGCGSHRGRACATLVVFLMTAGIIALLCLLIMRPITHEVNGLQKYFHITDRQQFREFVGNLRDTIDDAIAPFRSMLPPEVAANLEQDIPIQLGRAFSQLNLQQRVMVWFSHVGFILELILLPVMVFYFLSDGPAIRHEVGLLVPHPWRPRLRRMADHFDRVLDGYVRGQVIMCLIAWIMVTAVLGLFRVPNAYLLGIIAGITRAVPVIGPLLGLVPIILVTLLTTRDIPTVVNLTIGFSIMHAVESKVLLPKIVGHEVDLHPVSVIIALLIGLKFFGFIGIFLAVPIAAVIKILLAEWHTSMLQNSDAETGTPLHAGELPVEISSANGTIGHPETTPVASPKLGP